MPCPTSLQNILDYSPSVAGLLILPITLPMVAVLPLTWRYVRDPEPAAAQEPVSDRLEGARAGPAHRSAAGGPELRHHMHHRRFHP